MLCTENGQLCCKLVYFCYCQSLSLAWTNTLAYYGIRAFLVCTVLQSRYRAHNISYLASSSSSLMGTVISYEENWVFSMWYLVSFSQHFIFFVTYECAQLMLNYTRLEKHAMYKWSILPGQFVSYEKNEVLWIWYLVLYSQHFITYKI